MGKITHLGYYDGNFQSLGFIADGEGKSVTVINPGVYNFREEKHEVVIIVVAGEIIINGTRYKPYQRKNIKKGEAIILETENTSIYLKETKGYRK
ncbi:MAG: pyrimidine/purine nucleoside phosphorylase [Candidatus Shapirobacteria bacterium]|nr:pyrimidine/purine nucleoside phosphorylase [Candidatus Shapirobacteria bacterium]MDD3002931.1 pyrimidine/purine nucleoside phosphorylase [Candidatus Shapirobacteria bacterium]MDD4383383.1 pyrimidine/purine nucleoside phosphorylase [Candidatus Shapirobacteria bacterium]